MHAFLRTVQEIEGAGEKVHKAGIRGKICTLAGNNSAPSIDIIPLFCYT
jgi:hypothetical protein